MDTPTRTDTDTVRLTTGIHTVELSKAVAEATELLHFSMPLPTIPYKLIQEQTDHLKNQLFNEVPRARLAMEHWNQSITDMLRLIKFDRKTTEQTFRSKRGIAFLGSVFSFCCDLITENQMSVMQGDVENLHNSVRQLASRQSTLQENVVHTLENFKNFTETVQNSYDGIQYDIRTMGRSFNRQQRTTDETFLHVIYMTQLTTTVMEIIDRENTIKDMSTLCNKNLLSPEIVPVAVLDSKIQHLLNQTAYKNMELAVNNLELLYSSPVTYCKISTDKINFWVKIPLKRMHAQWKLMQFQPMPFAWDGKICRLFPENERLIVAISDDHFVPLEGILLQHCLDNYICQISRIDASYRRHSQCVKAVISKRTVRDLITECDFTCEASSHPQIIQLGPHHFMVATTQQSTLTLKCGRHEADHNTIGYGAHRFVIPGNCSLLIDGKIAVSERLTMPNNLEQERGAEFMLPALWTNSLQMELDSIRDLERATAFTDSRLINSSWPSYSTVFVKPSPLPPISIEKLKSKPFKAYKFFPGEDLVTLVLILVLIVIVMILAIFVIILKVKIEYALKLIQSTKATDTPSVREQQRHADGYSEAELPPIVTYPPASEPQSRAIRSRVYARASEAIPLQDRPLPTPTLM